MRLARPSIPVRFLLITTALVLSLPVAAYLAPDSSSPLLGKVFSPRGGAVEAALTTVGTLKADSRSSAQDDLAALGLDPSRALLDRRGERWATLWMSEPLFAAPSSQPGGGPAPQVTPDEVRARFLAYLNANKAALRIDPLEVDLNVGIHSGGELILIHGKRRIGSTPVRQAGINGAIRDGQLFLFGSEHWGDVEVSTEPTLTEDLALDAALRYLAPLTPSGLREAPHLEILPLAASQNVDAEFQNGQGYEHRLAWILPMDFAGVSGGFQAVVDAHGGQVLAFEDTWHYEDVHYGDQQAAAGAGGSLRNVQGGVFPISNDGQAPDGIEVAGYPMPFATVTHSGGSSTTDAGGNVAATGTMTTDLTGPYLAISDGCGAVTESSAATNLDLGTSGGTDCTTPPGASAGNTHAARTVFYELNRLQEIGRGQLPTNSWVASQLPARVNDSVFCNAGWTGAGVIFFREQGSCANLGELAGVVDHEWGHGMDDNGTNGSVSSPGEGIADVYAALRINSSCPGRGALASTCGGFGDPCTPAFGCNAARDIDWMRHNSQTPHDVAWVLANCSGFVHCRGMLTGETVWDLYTRDLPNRYGMDTNTALEVATRLTYLGADNVSTWYSTSNGTEGGCSASSGYQQFLVADDDNGNLLDGTPHMQAIFDAFDRHHIACSTPTVQDSGCADAPTTAPVVAATPTVTGADLSWAAVPNATRYKIFRTDGEFQCDFGKAIVGETTNLTFADTGLQDGRETSYVVAAFSSTDACMGPTSACATVTPGVLPIFADGFESGTTAGWDGTVGGV